MNKIFITGVLVQIIRKDNDKYDNIVVSIPNKENSVCIPIRVYNDKVRDRIWNKYSDLLGKIASVECIVYPNSKDVCLLYKSLFLLGPDVLNGDEY